MERRMNIFWKAIRCFIVITSIVLILTIICPICFKLTRNEFFWYATFICVILDCVNLGSISYLYEELVRLKGNDDKN